MIATKFDIVRAKDQYERRLNNSSDYITRDFEESLQRLGADYIDFYCCRRRDHDTPIYEMMHALSILVKQGKVWVLACLKFQARHCQQRMPSIL